jgi:hypothetical protein
MIRVHVGCRVGFDTDAKRTMRLLVSNLHIMDSRTFALVLHTI